MRKRKLVVITAIIAVSSFLALLGGSDAARADPGFETFYETAYNDTTAGGPGNATTGFGFRGFGAKPDPTAFPMNFAVSIATLPPDVTITPGSALPLNRVVGSVIANVVLGNVNLDCTTPVTAAFTMRNASTNPIDTVSPMPDGVFNRMGNLRMDVNPADTFADHIGKYPDFLNELFDPEDTRATGKVPTVPLRPLARYSGDTNVLGTEVILQLVVFGREALSQYSNTPKHPLQQFTDDFGYTSVTVLQDPTANAAPSTVTDFCAPFDSTITASALDLPEASLISNQCANNTDDDGDFVVNDGCVSGPGATGTRVGVSESDVGGCADNVDGTVAAGPEDTPADGIVNDGCGGNENGVVVTSQCAGFVDDDGDGRVNDGCPANGPPETGADCVDAGDTTFLQFDDDGDGDVNDGCPTVGGNRRYSNPPNNTGIFKTNTHRFTSFNLSFRDADGDGLENSFDTCPFESDNDGDGLDEPRRTFLNGNLTAGATTIAVDDASVLKAAPGTIQIEDEIITYSAKTGNNLTVARGALGHTRQLGGGVFAAATTAAPHLDDTAVHQGWNPRANRHPPAHDADGDGIPAGCDDNNSTPSDDVDGDGFKNTQDNCPQVANPGQVESERDVPYATAAPDGGPSTDGIGDACDGVAVPGNPSGKGSKTVADGLYNATFHVTPICFASGIDTDGDGWCDGTEQAGSNVLGSCASDPCNAVSFPACPVPANCDQDSTPEHIAVDFALPITNGNPIVGGAGQGESNPLNTCGGGSTALCGQTAACGNAFDDDGDGTANDGCGATPLFPASAGPAQTCSDGIDNDKDGAIDGADGLGGATLLNGAHDDSITTITVDDTSTFPAPASGKIKIDSEIISYTGKTGTTFTGATRGVDGTLAAAHADNAPVRVPADPGCSAASAGKDPDGDGVCNTAGAEANKCIEVASVDNCPSVKNVTQQNTDFDLNAAGATVDPDGAGPTAPQAVPADSLGNACDPDDDNDSFTGGSGAAATLVTGDAVNGVCRSSASKPLYQSTTASVPAFNDCIEQYLGTNQLDNCESNAGLTNNEDFWPPNFRKENGLAPHNQVIDLGDTFDFSTAQTAQNLRGDLNADLSVNLYDNFLLINSGVSGSPPGFFNKRCL